MKIARILLIALPLCFVPLSLFAGSITNEGETPVKLSGKTKSGILAAMTINPGETLPLRQPVLWVEHVPEGTMQVVNIKIIEDNGNTGSIQAPGGRYTFSNQPQAGNSSKSSGRQAILRQAGYAVNSSNVQISITLIKQDGRTLKQRVMPGQTVNIPEDTVEVKVGTLDSNRGNEEVDLLVVMPDGKQHLVRSSKTSIALSPEAR